MKYEIKSKSDFATGSFLSLSIPDDEVDHCALNTIHSDCPDFILPFSYKCVDGQVEFTYKIGTLNKLIYFSGDFTAHEYIEFWKSFFEPLTECRDWFMKPHSFVFSVDYLYYDKHSKKVTYLYIPSLSCDSSDTNSFNTLASELSKIITVSDVNLENKLLRAIMNNFTPADTIKMFKNYLKENSASQSGVSGEIASQSVVLSDSEPRPTAIAPLTEVNPKGGIKPPVQMQPTQSFVAESQPESFYKEECFDIADDLSVCEQEVTSSKVFGGFGKKKKGQRQNDENKNVGGVESARAIRQSSKSKVIEKPEIVEITQSIPVIHNGMGLKYVGTADFPGFIQVEVKQGGIFTIGRFDSAIGKKQSDFEFDKKTKAVSRRHAVIEREAGMYKIIDLSSSAGTFVNKQRLPPNTPCELEMGTRVSFGNLGADYVWEVS